MRRWGFSLVGFLLISASVFAADISQPQALYFRGYDYMSNGATNERVKGPETALEYYLKARDCFVQLMEKHPTFSPDQVRRKLAEVDAKLRPVLLSQGIAPEKYLKAPRTQTYPPVVRTPVQPAYPPQPPARPVVPPIGGGVVQRPPMPSAVPPATRQGYEEFLAQTRAQIQARDLQTQRQLADYEAKLREAMAARPKSLDPGELSKQVAENKALQKDYDFLKTENRRGEGQLAKAMDELGRLQRENEYLQMRLSEAGSPRQMELLREENKSLRRQLAELQRIAAGRVGMGALQTQLTKERSRAAQLEAENLRLRRLLTAPSRP